MSKGKKRKTYQNLGEKYRRKREREINEQAIDIFDIQYLYETHTL